MMRSTHHIGMTIATIALIVAGPVAGRAGAQDEHAEIHLDQAAMHDFGITVETAGPGALPILLRLPGEIVVDPDRLAHVVPRVPGVTREVFRAVGDTVKMGQPLAILDSRELSMLKSVYLVARERLELARSTSAREERLWGEKVSSEREYLAAQQARAEAGIELRAAEQRLHAIGLDDAHLETLAFDEDASFIRYTLTAPFDGVVVQKHIALGEFVKDEETVFVIADLSRVWVNLSIYQQDLSQVRAGQPVRVIESQTGLFHDGTIEYVSPLLDRATRTAAARVVLHNDGRWRPGLFVEGLVRVAEESADLVVPRQALQNVDGQMVLFVETDDGFKARVVTMGRSNDTHAEITAGLHVGERFAATGAFTLKAQLEKDSFASGHNH
ncbi:MAG: efflux RND transporter periplasmic adaptor subunit [Gemmatimonadetes bacterium]|jgi:membrane fusion protein, heavy metal efflux system|nr:efflux RND transporter periplasmic adaptor subunit [Gemmatimonadota bacterium]MBT6148491.1 efflux RND transporter periplasmic adaptor subunit [Gemmatimonadota bacterium]